MDSLLYDFLPLVLFFLVVAGVFHLTMYTVGCLIGPALTKYWNVAKFVAWAVFAGVVMAIAFYSRVVSILISADWKLRLFALIMALAMLLIFLVSLRMHPRTCEEKPKYALLFTIIALIFFAVLINMANQRYFQYEKFVCDRLIDPGLAEAKKLAEKNEQDRLYKQFQESYRKGECHDIDYRLKPCSPEKVRNFLFVADEPALAYGQADPSEPESYMVGKECSDDANQFLLTKSGAWYWVIESTIIR